MIKGVQYSTPILCVGIIHGYLLNMRKLGIDRLRVFKQWVLKN